MEKKEADTFLITFQEPWIKEEPSFVFEYTNEYKLKILEDLGECMDWVENEEGIPEWTKVHKYKVEKINDEADK